MSTESYGSLNFALTLGVLVSAVVLFGFDPLLLRELTLKRHDIAARDVLVVKTAIAFPAIILAAGYSSLSGASIPFAVGLMLLSGGVVSGYCETPETILAHYARYGQRAAVQSVPYLVFGCGIIALVYLVSVSPTTFLFLFAIMYLLREAARWTLGSRLMRRLESESPHATNRVGALRLLQLASPFAAVSVLAFLYFRLDAILLLPLAGERQTGIYAASYNVFTGFLVLTGAMSPLIFQYVASEPHEARRLAWIFGAAGCACSVATIVVAPVVVEVIYGPRYGAASGVLRLLACTLPMSLFNSVSLRHCYVLGRERRLPRLLSLVTVFNLAVNAVLQPRFGAAGAAFATVATEAALTGAFLYILRDPAPRSRIGMA